MGRRLSMYTQSADRRTKGRTFRKVFKLLRATSDSACCYLCLEDTLFFFFPSRVKFNWNASNRIKDFSSATRMPFQSKHYAEGELSYCSSSFIQRLAVELASFALPHKLVRERAPALQSTHSSLNTSANDINLSE